MKKLIASIMVLSIAAFSATNAYAALTDTATVTATINTDGVSSLLILEDTIAFGTITPTGTDHRKAKGPLTVEFFAATSPYHIDIHTTHGVDTGTDNRGGLIGADGTTLLAMKVWTANYGPASFTADPDCAAPDVEDDNYWADPAAEPTGWFWIFDTRGATRRELIGEDAEITGSFTAYLGIDTQSMKPQAYGYTAGNPAYGRVTIEFVAE